MPQKPDFRRQELRQASRFIEGDYEGINPREFFRHLRRQLEELQRGEEFKYKTIADRDRDLEIRQEAVGDKTGVVTGRLEATSEWAPVGAGSLVYRPWNGVGVLFILLGLFVSLLGSLFSPFYLVGPFAILGGIYVYRYEDVGEVPIQQRDTIKTLIEGEVSEKTIQGKQGKRTEMSANMSVIYSGDVFLRVSPHSVSGMPWGLRTELLSTLRDWQNSKDASPQGSGRHPAADTISTGFWGAFAAWTLDSSKTKRRLTLLQNRINQAFDVRQAYAEFLSQILEARGVREQELDEVMDELESLKGGMDIYVDREGLEPAR